MYSIYKLTVKDGMSYIGVTNNLLSRRLKHHLSCTKQVGFSDRHYKGIYLLNDYSDSRLYLYLYKNRDKEISMQYLGMCGDKYSALYVEQEMIALHKTYRPYGLNTQFNKGFLNDC